MPNVKKKPKLTAKQAAFVREYLIDFNAAGAARRAGYSKKTAQQIGEQNLLKVVIATEIQAAIDKRAERTGVTQDRVLEEYAKLAFLDPRLFYDKSGNLIPVHMLPADIAATMTGMDVSIDKFGDVTKKIKFSDKRGSLDSLAKHLGMFIERVEHGFDDATLGLVLAALPPEYAAAVKKALMGKK